MYIPHAGSWEQSAIKVAATNSFSHTNKKTIKLQWNFLKPLTQSFMHKLASILG